MTRTSAIEHGWDWDPVNARLDFYYRGTRIGHIDAAGLTGALGLAATTTITSGTDLSVDAGNTTVTAGDARVTAGNFRLGAVTAFSGTEPTSAVVMKVGTNPVGAIATSGGIFVTTGGATISKIVAGGSVNTIQS